LKPFIVISTILSLLSITAACPTLAAPFAYVANNVSNTVSVIDTATNTVKATIPVGQNPSGVAVHPDGSKVFVLNHVSDTISVIGTLENAVIHTLTDTAPRYMALSPLGDTLYLGSQLGPYTWGLVELDSASYTVKRSITTGTGINSGLGGVAVSPDGSEIYVSDGSWIISVFDTATLSLKDTITLDWGTCPWRITFSPDGTRVYVLLSGSERVLVLDSLSHATLGLIWFQTGEPPYYPRGPYDLVVDSTGRTVYVTLSSSSAVAVVDTDLLVTTQWIPVATPPYGIAISPDGTRLYVTHGSGTTTFVDNKVSVIDTSSKTLVAAIEVGRAPAVIGKLIGGLEPPDYAVTIEKEGDGSGIVTAITGEIDCGTLCSAGYWPNTPITLTASPEGDSVFSGWSGPCTDKSLACTFVVTDNVKATATFRKNHFVASDYFPLTPGTVWQYRNDTGKEVAQRVLDKKIKVEGVETTVVSNPYSRVDNYFTSTAQGIFLHAQSQKGVFISGIGLTNVFATFLPPIKMSDAEAGIGTVWTTTGTAKLKAGPWMTNTTFNAQFTLSDLDQTTVPAGTFETLRLDGTITLSGYTIGESFFMTKNLGPVKDISTDLSGTQSVLELVSTNVGSHDLAVTEITAPKVVTLTKNAPTKTARLQVTIQNRSPGVESISDAAMLAEALHLAVTSLGTCPDLEPVMRTDQLQFPVALKPKQTLKVPFDVTFGCVNDPKRSTSKEPNHYDYRYGASINRAALDGEADTHHADDTCPRSVNPPYETDASPDGTIRDRGCGARKPDGTFGGEILTDIVR
jgi:YVTN family beta-propeller protein